MRRTLGSALIVTGMMLAPAVAVAQHDMGGMPPHEVGVDLGIAYLSPSGGNSIFSIGTPVDVRLGFVMHSGWSFEPRVIFQYLSSSGNSIHNIDLDANALFPVGSGSTYRKGMYLTAGGGLDFTNTAGITGRSGTLLQINGGIGTRVPYETGAIRLEAYAKYRLQDTSIGFPNTFEIGGRVGLSLWH